MKKITILVISALLVNYVSMAQDSRSPESTVKKSSNFLISTKQAEALLEVYKKHPYTIYYDNLIVEYEKRMKANAHKYKVMARKMKKPQYSDPSYFGHKRKPKKRAVGKRKYCHECEIVH
jgi:hypothetical protein